MDLRELELRAARFDTATGVRQLAVAIAALLFLGMGTCVAKGANGPDDPRLVVAATVPPFAQVGMQLTPAAPAAVDAPPTTAAGQPAPTVAPTAAAQLCALLADTALTIDKNLVGRWDLGGYAAMVIDQGRASSAPFPPRAINFPTSIAFFDTKGAFLGAADVEACPAQTGCLAVPPPAPYRYLVLAPRGQLAAWGVGPGARLELAPTCVAPPPPSAPAPS